MSKEINGVPEGFCIDRIVRRQAHPWPENAYYEAILKRVRNVVIVPEFEIPAGHIVESLCYATPDDELHSIPFHIEERK